MLIGFGTSRGGVGVGVAGVAVRVGDAHAEVVAADSFGSVFADQQCHALLLVTVLHRYAVGGRGLDGLRSVGQAGFGLGRALGDPDRPLGETVGADLSAQLLSVSGRGAVCGAGFAPAEPPHGGEPDACSGFVFDGGEVGGTTLLGLGGERPGDFGAFGFVVEACEFFRDECDRPVCDESAHGFVCGAGGVVEAPVCRVAFHRLDKLRPGIREVRGDDVEPVRLAASRHADVDACRARGLRQHRAGTIDGCALDTVGGRRIGQVRMLTQVLRRERDGSGLVRLLAASRA